MRKKLVLTIVSVFIVAALLVDVGLFMEAWSRNTPGQFLVLAGFIFTVNGIIAAYALSLGLGDE